MTTKLFVGSTIRHHHVQNQMEQAWRNIHEQLPDHAARVERKPPHLTLRYFGQVQEHPSDHATGVLELTETIQRVTDLFEPITLTLGAVHTFAGVAWISIGGYRQHIDALDQLAQQVDQAIQSLNGPYASPPPRLHAFAPHLTLAKFDPDITDLVQHAANVAQAPRPLPFTIERVEVIQSRRDFNNALIHTPQGPGASLRQTESLAPCAQKQANAA